MKIGITGLPGSGKSTVGEILEKFGFTVIYVDECIPELYMFDDVMEVLNEEFGISYITAGEARYKLRECVFDDRKKLNRLEEITLPHLQRMVSEMVEEAHEKNNLVAIEYALLMPSGLGGLCNKVINVVAPIDERVDRVKEREWSKEDLVKRDKRQNESRVVSPTEVIIGNSGTLEDLEKKVKDIVDDLKKEFGLRLRDKILDKAWAVLYYCLLNPLQIIFLILIALLFSIFLGFFCLVREPHEWIMEHKGIWIRRIYPFSYMVRFLWILIPVILGILISTYDMVDEWCYEDDDDW